MLHGLYTQIPETPQNRIVDVGWAITDTKASLIWDDPAQFSQKMGRPASAKSVQLCPAALDFDSRHYVVPCPVDLHIALHYNEQKQPVLQIVEGAKSTIRGKHLNSMISIVAQNEWRHPERPIIQVITPYLFMADEVVYINQLPPYLNYIDPAWPGLLIAGRFPINIWPRPLMWAFEWHDTSKELNIKRGDPWFYLRFEAQDPARPIRLQECELTPDVKHYVDSLSGVTNYVNRTYSLFERAQKRRPATLLNKKEPK
jgi:hypothetical protein